VNGLSVESARSAANREFAGTVVSQLPDTLMYRPLCIGSWCFTVCVALSAQEAATNRTTVPTEVLKAVGAISLEELRQTIAVLSAPEMEGRYTPSAGLTRAAALLEEGLKRAAVPTQPGFPYRREIPIVERYWDAANSGGVLDGMALAPGEDFFPTAAVLDGTAAGRLVYVGHGFQVPAKDIDPYKGVDVRGKILVTTTARPPGLTLADTPGTPGETWHDARTFGLNNGALGIVVIPTAQVQGLSATERRSTASHGRLSLDPLPIRYLPAIGAMPATVRVLFRGAQFSGDEVLQAAAKGDALPSFALPQERQLSFTVALRKVSIPAANVIGMIPGSDPALRDEYVVLGAHYDHLGVLDRDGKREVFLGADDNASGSAAVLAVARALALAPRPRRSVMFAFFASEERLHLGSRHFIQAPIVPVRDVVAMIDLDMVGRSRKADENAKGVPPVTVAGQLYVQGPRLTSVDLDGRLRAVVAQYGSLSLDGSMDDPPYLLFGGGDFTTFAQAGVPTASFFSGIHDDYHQPTDSADKIDYQKVRSVAHDAALVVWHLADAEQRPTSKPLPPQLTVP
jgi:hypothetical protein